MSAETLAVGLALGLGLWSVLSAVWAGVGQQTMAERIAPYLRDVSSTAREITRPLVTDPLVIAGYVLTPTARAWVTRIDRMLGGSDTQRPTFLATGRFENFAAFRHHRALRAVISAGVGSVAGALAAGVAPWGMMAGVALGAVVGAVAAIGVIDYHLRKQARVRAERVSEEFPTVIELLGLALAAGDSLPRALARVSRKAHGELGKEWARVMTQVDLGAPLAETLRASAQRVASERVVAFVEHLAQALDRGAPLAEVVAAHTLDAKADYSRGLVEKAGKAEVRMLVPMVLLILPVTVIFAVYPGIQALQFDF
ncbi:MAG: tight adherence protein C [Pontimonas sp.]|jgi:tight adherence protein C